MPQKWMIETVPALVWGEDCDRVFLFVHGKHGCKEEASAFAELVCPRGWQVLSIDLPEHGERQNRTDGVSLVPWEAVPELRAVMAQARARWKEVSLYAVSIGAWLSLLAFPDTPPVRSLFVSPVLDMNALIKTMMGWAQVTEEQLQQEGCIPTSFGETLSWKYACFARKHPISSWSSPTEILYGSADALTSRQTVASFVRRFGCGLTVLEGGEHWFHTPEQLAFLRAWETRVL